MYWTDTADGHHCNRHDFTFRRGEVCHACVADPGDAPGGISLDEQEVAALRAHISDLRTKERMLWRVAEGLFEGTDRDVAAACKVTAEFNKTGRRADELQATLDGFVRDDRLLHREQAMSGQRRGN